MLIFIQKKRKKDYRNKIVRHILNGFCYNIVNQIIKGKIQQKIKRFPQNIINQVPRKKTSIFWN